jgi:hypothetical protein
VLALLYNYKQQQKMSSPAAKPQQVADARKLLYAKIGKLSQLVSEIQKRQEADAHILDDPIAEM